MFFILFSVIPEGWPSLIYCNPPSASHTQTCIAATCAHMLGVFWAVFALDWISVLCLVDWNLCQYLLNNWLFCLSGFYVTITCTNHYLTCVISRPYGIDLHCHRRETLTAFFFLGHMACVGVCLCMTGVGVWPLIVTSLHRWPVCIGEGFTKCVFMSGFCFSMHAHSSVCLQ